MAFQTLLGIVQTPKIEIETIKESANSFKSINQPDGTVQNVPIFYDGENIAGTISINIRRGSKYEHQGIKVDFLGIIEYYGDRANREEFVSLSHDLARPGILQQPVKYPYEFTMVDKPYESYSGTLLRIKYILRVTIVKRLTNVVKDKEIIVNTLSHYSEIDTRIKMEVGIEDSLHIEFEYDKSQYHLKDVIIGKIYFILVRVKIKNMELHIMKKETIGYGVNTFTENETIAKYEIMDGAPVKGESIPIRLFLSQFDLTPTIHDSQRKFSVRYLLNLVLLDEEDRRYYKHQEILIYRRTQRKRKQYAHVNKELMDKVNERLALTTDNAGCVEDGSEDGSVLSGESYNRVERSMQRYEPNNPPEAFQDATNGPRETKLVSFERTDGDNNNDSQSDLTENLQKLDVSNNDSQTPHETPSPVSEEATKVESEKPPERDVFAD